MRFCPFCAQDNPDDARECVHCGKRLPALRPMKSPVPPTRQVPMPPVTRPAPPRPQPRVPSLAGVPPQNGKVPPNEPTLVDAHPQAATGTLLGLPAQEVATLVAAQHPEHGDAEERRTTKPLSVGAIAPRRPPAEFDDLEGPTIPRHIVRGSGEPHASTVAVKTPPPMKVPSAEPLPPPPLAGNDAGAFPLIDPGPTPAIPTLALPPMPEAPASRSIVDAVKYLPPVGKALWARRKAQQAIRTLLHGDQRLLDSVLGDLGRAAHEARVNAPAIADEIARIEEQEQRRASAEARIGESEVARNKEDERWHYDLGERQSELARREAEIKVSDEELKTKLGEKKRVEHERAQIEGQMRAHHKRAQGFIAKAEKAEATPPEKGGGPNTAANLRAEAAAAEQEAAALTPARDAKDAELAELSEPINALTAKLDEDRATLQQKKKELVQAKAAHQQACAEIDAARAEAESERVAADGELLQRFVTAGTMLNLNRVEHPRLQPLFARIDDVRREVNAREAAIVRLESERRLYDRATVQKGLLTVGIAAGTLVILAIILIVAVAR